MQNESNDAKKSYFFLVTSTESEAEVMTPESLSSYSAISDGSFGV